MQTHLSRYLTQALIGDVTADLCIVGAGYTGLWTALLAKEADPRT
jgi:ribulose 1,5-bisphosphate synthetase/thiazole synthase